MSKCNCSSPGTAHLDPDRCLLTTKFRPFEGIRGGAKAYGGWPERQIPPNGDWAYGYRLPQEPVRHSRETASSAPLMVLWPARCDCDTLLQPDKGILPRSPYQG